MDGLALTNPYAQAQKDLAAHSAATHSVQLAPRAGQWPSTGPARPQGQWGAPAPARGAAPWGPGQPYAVQAMPAQAFQCFTCGQADHYARDCLQGSAQHGRVGARPQGLIKDEAGTSPEGAPAAQTEEIEASWCAIGA